MAFKHAGIERGKERNGVVKDVEGKCDGEAGKELVWEVGHEVAKDSGKVGQAQRPCSSDAPSSPKPF